MQNSDALGPKALEDHLEERLEFHEPLARQATRHRLSGVDEQPRKQMQRSLAHVTGSMTHRLAGLGGIDSAGCGPGLHAGFLIRADDDLSPLSQFVSPLVEIQRNSRFLEELRVGRLLPGVALPRFDLVLPEPSANGRGSHA